MTATTHTLSDLIRGHAHPLTGAADELDPLIDMIGDARLVLLGEATHGTHEFYFMRGEISRRLVEEKGFNAVAVEADWPDAYRVNRYVQMAHSHDQEPVQALGDFKRFPLWMWRNTEAVNLIRWLRQHNEQHERPDRCGFYGLDLYSLSSSIEAVIGYLDRVDPDAAARARYRYSCFEDFAEDPQKYGYAATLGLSKGCEDEAVAQLAELRRRAAEYLRRDGLVARDEQFFAEQNARLARNAEEYYRTMFGGRVSSWNVRDRHMAETIEALLTHLGSSAPPARLVIWEHNSHIGDARATAASDSGELNVGQLVRERHGAEAFLVGFTTYDGEVSAASDWDSPVERKRVRPALPGSYEALLHETGLPRFLLPLRDEGELRDAPGEPRLERAIGVIYRPETERMSHYFRSRLPEQFDAVIHFDRTRALDPLDRNAGWVRGEWGDETYPTGL